MFERFTKPARAVVVRAQTEARALEHDWVGTEHLLLAVLGRPEEPGAATLVRLGVTAGACRAAVTALVVRDAEALDAHDAEALKTFGIDLDEIRSRADATFGKGALDRVPGPGKERPRRLFAFGRRNGRTQRPDGHLPFTPRARKALELSLREALAVKDRHIGVEHLVLALLRSDDRLTRALLGRLGIEPGAVRETVLADLRRAA